MPPSVVQVRTEEGDVVTMGGIRVTPIARTLLVRMPRPAAVGLVWSWPWAVKVARDDGATIVLPIVDVTRRVQAALLGVVVLVGVLTIALRRIRR